MKDSQIQFQKWQFKPLADKGLCSYMQIRGIDLSIAQRLCGEIHYIYRNRRYYGIAFANSSGGCEVRNAYFKGCMGSKDITICYQKRGERQRHVCIFEGFMDFLSYLTLSMKGDIGICIHEPTDYIVLNSLCCLKRGLDALVKYDYIHCYLDNDAAGVAATQTIVEVMNGGVTDESMRYKEYKDLNDYLRGKKV